MNTASTIDIERTTVARLAAVATRIATPAWPGMLVCAVVALSAAALAERIGGPPLLYALVLGLALNFLASDARLSAGIALCARVALRVGVALLGARITISQVLALGGPTALGVVAVVAATIAVGWLLARLLARPAAEGVLSGCAVGICGASAALAVSAALPPGRDTERFTLLVVIGVTLLSTLAMVLYPLGLTLAGAAPQVAGVMLGASIHDVAQVVGAGMMMGPEVGETAAIVKLLRVALLAPVVLLVALAFRARGGAPAPGPRTPLLPGFVVGFLVLVLLASLGWIGPAVADQLQSTSRWLMLLAIAACGIKTRFADLRLLGWQPVVMLVVETAFIAALAAGVAVFCGPTGAP
ncbi:MAG TPA: putative sulfate exporter family transporter [Ramlibacter sp.]|nr:putative sulfate exporter family transporter [Ramlibacter sp.]